MAATALHIAGMQLLYFLVLNNFFYFSFSLMSKNIKRIRLLLLLPQVNKGLGSGCQEESEGYWKSDMLSVITPKQKS